MVILVDLKSCTKTPFLQIKLVTITKNRSIWSSVIYFRFIYIFIKIKYFIGRFGVKYRWTFTVFTNLRLVLLWLLSDWVVPKFHLRKKAREKSGKWSNIEHFRRWRDSFSSMYVLNSDRARSFNQSLRYWLWGYRQWLWNAR